MVTMQEFRSWQKKHPNFVTPEVIKAKKKGNKFIELSQGWGFNNDRIYGVSVINYKNGKFEAGTSNKSKSFFSKAKALSYYNKL